MLKSYEAYLEPADSLEIGYLRLLEPDNHLVVPAMTHIRLLITSTDVLHAYAVPSLGIKCDAVPGRLNQVSLYTLREGTYYGQCSEICGIQHAYMPTAITATTPMRYAKWLASK